MIDIDIQISISERSSGWATNYWSASQVCSNLCKIGSASKIYVQPSSNESVPTTMCKVKYCNFRQLIVKTEQSHIISCMRVMFFKRPYCSAFEQRLTKRGRKHFRLFNFSTARQKRSDNGWICMEGMFVPSEIIIVPQIGSDRGESAWDKW